MSIGFELRGDTTASVVIRCTIGNFEEHVAGLYENKMKLLWEIYACKLECVHWGGHWGGHFEIDPTY